MIGQFEQFRFWIGVTATDQLKIKGCILAGLLGSSKGRELCGGVAKCRIQMAQQTLRIDDQKIVARSPDGARPNLPRTGYVGVSVDF